MAQETASTLRNRSGIGGNLPTKQDIENYIVMCDTPPTQTAIASALGVSRQAISLSVLKHKIAGIKQPNQCKDCGTTLRHRHSTRCRACHKYHVQMQSLRNRGKCMDCTRPLSKSGHKAGAKRCVPCWVAFLRGDAQPAKACPGCGVMLGKHVGVCFNCKALKRWEKMGAL